MLSCAGCVVHCHWRLTRTTQGATTAHCLDGGGRDGSNDKDAVIEEEGVDKDSLTEEAMVAAVATPSAGWHSNDDEVVDNGDVNKDNDAFVVGELLVCSRNLQVT